MRRRNFNLAVKTAFRDKRMTEEITLNGTSMRAFVDQVNVPEGDFRTDMALTSRPGWFMCVRRLDHPEKPLKDDPIVRKGEPYHVQSSEIDGLNEFWEIDVDKGS